MNMTGLRSYRCSRGLGMAFARALAERHCNLVLVVGPRNLSTHWRTNCVGPRRSPWSLFQADLSFPGQSSPDGTTIRWQDSDDLLVNNAGFGLRGEFCGLSIRRQLEMLRQHQAIVRAHYSLLPRMLERQQKGTQPSLDCRLSGPFPLRASIPQLKPF